MPRLLSHAFPISVGMSNSAVMTANLTRTSPEASRSSLGRVMETISLSMEARLARREERQVPEVPIIAFPPQAQETPMDTAGDREGRPTEPDPPVIFEGMDDICSICQDGFQHGQRVCRLSCRHMFHAACWESAQSSFSTTPQTPRLSCPNCRGAGTLIAIWHYIDENRATQEVGGLQVPNLLETGASMHTTHTPPGRVQTPRSVLTPRSARASQSVP